MERGGPYVLVNGVTVATDWDDLTDGTINTPINVDERGNGVVGEWVCAYGELWSNTDAQGNTVGDACAGWTTTSGSSGNGGGARVASTDETWTSPVCPSVKCSAPLSIYCVQQP